MKKIIIILTAIGIFVIALIATAVIFFGPNNDKEAPNMSEPYNKDESTTAIWVEEGETQIIDRDNSRRIGISFREVDLSKPTWAGQSWDERGFACEPRSDLTQILSRSISTRDEAACIANEIIASEQKTGNILGGSAFELMGVDHDPNKNIWIFHYCINDIRILSNTFHVAVNGENGELIRMWVE